MPQAYFISKIFHSFREERISLKKDLVIRQGLFSGGSGWIRTTEGGANRFTVCPLWPLGNTPMFTIQKNGAGGRTRTPDLLITNQLLYQLSYTSTLMLEQYNTILFGCQAYFLKFLKFFIFPLQIS